MTPDSHYIDPRLAEVYDLDSPWSIERDFYLALAGEPRKNVLDLGCGTGLLCDAFAAQGHNVTGVDPAASMLDVARRKPNGKQVEWIQSTSQDFESSKKFDLIIMTGNAFQVLMEDADVLGTFNAMRKHLQDKGLIAFETRNPNLDWKQHWHYEMDIETPNGIVRESRHFTSMHNNRMRFELRYEFPSDTLVSQSELRFWSKNEIETHLQSAGLKAEKVLGDWDGEALDEARSKEMVFMIRAI